VWGAAACGPIGYLQQVHGKARDAVTEARHAGAETAAPYEYTSAVEYLKKAEEEGDHAEYQVAIEYGRQAEAFAQKARKIATASAGPESDASPKGSP
jgi:undecaprenyl pyrophosphate synthase